MQVLPFIILILSISLGILFGLWTPVEAAAVGVIFVFIMGLVTGNFTVGKLVKAFVDSVQTSAAIMLVVVGSMMFGKFLALTGLNEVITKTIISLDLSSFQFFLILMVVYLILGMFLEATSILALTVPLLIPAVKEIGWSPIWFGVVLVLMMEIASVTPPVGLNLYAVKATVPELEMNLNFESPLFR